MVETTKPRRQETEGCEEKRARDTRDEVLAVLVAILVLDNFR